MANSTPKSTKAGSVSDLIRATVAEFGSMSGEILRHAPTLAEIAEMAPTEVLPCSMSSLQDNPTHGKLRTPVQLFLCFVQYLLVPIELTGSESSKMIGALARIKRRKAAAQYSCTPATHPQQQHVGTPVFKPLNGEIGEADHQSADPVVVDHHPNPGSDAVAASTQAAWQLPLPARRVWHSLTSLLLTLKLAAFTSTDIAGPLIWKTIYVMKEDLAVGLDAFAEYSQQLCRLTTAAASIGQQAELSSSRIQAAQDIQFLSEHVITLVLAFLRRAVKELSREDICAGLSMAVACMGLVDVFLEHGPPAAGDKLFTAGACSDCAALCTIAWRLGSFCSHRCICCPCQRALLYIVLIAPQRLASQ